MSAGGKVAELVVVTSRLVELMDREVELLHSGRVGDITPLVAEKARLTKAYEADLESLREDPALFVSVEPALKRTLHEATERLRTAVARNAHALEAARDVNRRLMDAIVRAASAEQTRNRGYRSTGSGAAPAVVGRKESVSIAVDRHL